MCLYLQIMDDQWETEVIEYGAINITGFRIVDNSRRYVREFLENWRRLDNKTSPGAGRESISVGCIIGKKRRYITKMYYYILKNKIIFDNFKSKLSQFITYPDKKKCIQTPITINHLIIMQQRTRTPLNLFEVTWQTL